MKTPLTLLLLLLATATFAQTIRRVNADATVTGINVYTTLQAAHDAAIAGDVLIVEPGASVGNLTCNKTLTIYGRGYFLDQNSNYVALPNKSLSSTVAFITINAANVKILGVEGGRFDINGVSGVTISRCNFVSLKINGLSGSPVNYITISQNYITGLGSNDFNLYAVAIAGAATGLVSNVSVTNNQIIGIMNINFLSTNSYTSSILFNQNTITGTYSGFGNLNPYNTIFMNNIFVSGQAIPFSNNNSSYFNNAFPAGSTIDSGMGSNNIIVSNLNSQFITNTGSIDNNYRIANGSVLKTAGNTSGEVGMFGGATPYVQYGIPAAPAVLKVRSDGVGNSTTPITLTLSAKSNN